MPRRQMNRAPLRGRAKRRLYRKRPGGLRPRNVLINRALQPFAQRYITKMKYAESLNIVGPALGGLTQYAFNLNSIFDPNRTGFGHQPYGHDTMATLYNRYRVIKCSYVISGLAIGGSTGDQYGIVAVLPANEVAAITGGVAEVQENPKCKFITQAPQDGSKVLKGTVSLPSLMGRNKAQYMADDRFQATFGTSPSELGVLNVFAGLLNGAAEQITTKLNIVLEYTVECFDFKNLPQS